ncbi:MAG: hypothetical protein HYX38_12540 [Rhodospirillales bacterium]|nr:hypothetical protein [Rhodospirillales bacterium]
MNRRIAMALLSGAALAAAAGALIATAQPRGAVFIAGDRPVTEAQVREKLQSDGYSDVLTIRQGRMIEAMGVKDGQTGKVLVDAQTGRLAGDGDDDGDDDD